MRHLYRDTSLLIPTSYQKAAWRPNVHKFCGIANVRWKFRTQLYESLPDIVHTHCEMSILSNDAVHLLLQCVCEDRRSPWSLSVMNFCSPIPKHCTPFSDTGHVHNMFAIDCNKSSVNFTGSNVFRLQKPNHASHLTPAGFDIGAFIVTTRYTHNVKKFTAPTAPSNYLHSTEHAKWLIWYNETTARVVCANILYFPNSPPIFSSSNW